jgi:hypothetical protein
MARMKHEADVVDPGENDLIERLDELESNLTNQMRKTFQDFINIVIPKIEALCKGRYQVVFGVDVY